MRDMANVCEGCPIKFGKTHHRLQILGKSAASSMQKVGPVLNLICTYVWYLPCDRQKKKKLKKQKTFLFHREWCKAFIFFLRTKPTKKLSLPAT